MICADDNNTVLVAVAMKLLLKLLLLLLLSQLQSCPTVPPYGMLTRLLCPCATLYHLTPASLPLWGRAGKPVQRLIQGHQLLIQSLCFCLVDLHCCFCKNITPFTLGELPPTHPLLTACGLLEAVNSLCRLPSLLPLPTPQ